jgi:hypothetical protein
MTKIVIKYKIENKKDFTFGKSVPKSLNDYVGIEWIS